MAEFSTGYSCCVCGSVDECLGSRTCNQQVAGFNPGHHSAEQSWASCLHTCASVTKQYNMVPANGQAGDARLLGGNRGPGISNGSLLTHLWFRSLVGWLWRTIISYGTLRSHFEYGTTLPYLTMVAVLAIKIWPYDIINRAYVQHCLHVCYFLHTNFVHWVVPSLAVITVPKCK